MAVIHRGDQFVAVFEYEVEPRPERRHFGLVVDDVAAVVSGRERGASVRGNNVSDPQGNVSTSWRTSEIQFTKVEPLLRAQKAADLQKSEAALRELREKGIEL